jgi:hypothetical protein
MSPRPLLLIMMPAAALAVLSCTHREPGYPTPAKQPAIVSLTAKPATPAAHGEATSLLLRIRELKSESLTLSLRPPDGGMPLEAPADARLIKTVDVLVPIDHDFSAATELGRTTLRIAGNIRRSADGGYYRTSMDYSEITPIGRAGPGEPVCTVSFTGNYMLTKNQRPLLCLFCSAPGVSMFDVTIVEP